MIEEVVVAGSALHVEGEGVEEEEIELLEAVEIVVVGWEGECKRMMVRRVES